MEVKRKVVLIGSRVHVIKELINYINIKDLTVYALEGSFLESFLKERGVSYKTFNMNEKKACLDELLSLSFDILISNGCPILFPVNKFKTNQILINIHPTYLPHLQGKTPMNGVFYLKYNFYGATMHYIDSGVDTGDIIYQEREELTEDIDLGLLYHLALSMEGYVFKQGWEALIDSNFKNIGKRQNGTGTYFNRTDNMQTLIFEEEKTSNLLLKIKSFSVESQGCITKLEGKQYKIFDAEKIIHVPLLEKFSNSKPGEIVLFYDTKFLIKTCDGLIKIKSFKLLN